MNHKIFFEPDPQKCCSYRENVALYGISSNEVIVSLPSYRAYSKYKNHIARISSARLVGNGEAPYFCSAQHPKPCIYITSHGTMATTAN